MIAIVVLGARRAGRTESSAIKLQAAGTQILPLQADVLIQDAAGERTSMTDPLGNRTVYFYDDVGRLSFIFISLGNVTGQRHNAFGHVEFIIAHAVALCADAVVSGMERGDRRTSDAQARFNAIVNGADSIQIFSNDRTARWSTSLMR